MFLNQLETGILITNPKHTFIHGSHSRFSSNSEAFAPKLLENLEALFPRCYIQSDKFINLLKSSTTSQ